MHSNLRLIIYKNNSKQLFKLSHEPEINITLTVDNENRELKIFMNTLRFK